MQILWHETPTYVAIKLTCDTCHQSYADWRTFDGDTIHPCSPMSPDQARADLHDWAHPLAIEHTCD